jgi:hypothetical protein
MDDRISLLQQLDLAREQMIGALKDTDLAIEVYPSWTIKHVLAHIIGWDEASTVSIRAHIRGDDAGAPAARGIDSYNEVSVATRVILSYGQMVKEWEQARKHFKAAILDIPPEKVHDPMLYPWGDTGTAANLVRIFIHHEYQHATEIQKLKADRAAANPSAKEPA